MSLGETGKYHSILQFQPYQSIVQMHSFHQTLTFYHSKIIQVTRKSGFQLFFLFFSLLYSKPASFLGVGVWVCVWGGGGGGGGVGGEYLWSCPHISIINHLNSKITFAISARVGVNNLLANDIFPQQRANLKSVFGAMSWLFTKFTFQHYHIRCYNQNLKIHLKISHFGYMCRKKL